MGIPDAERNWARTGYFGVLSADGPIGPSGPCLQVLNIDNTTH